MTGEKLVEIFGDYMEDTAGMNECVHAILAALEKEREQEARDGWRVEFAKGQSTITLLVGVEHECKQGQLIFRPTKAEKGGE